MSKPKIYKNVKLGKNILLEPGVIIGLPQPNQKSEQIETFIGDNAYIRYNSIIYGGVTIGKNFQTGPNVLIRENNIIGDNVVIWHGSTLNPDNKIGNDCRIHAGCFLEMVTLEKKVFLGPGVIFTDDPHPVIPIKFRKCWGGATVKSQSVLGGNVTVLPHVIIGRDCLIGAGSVVVNNVPNGKVAVGNPAKVIKNTKDVICKLDDRPHKPYLNK